MGSLLMGGIYSISNEQKIKILNSYKWHRSLGGGWSQQHNLGHLTSKEILNINPNKLKDKLKYSNIPAFIK